jgi:hypothetical protein
MELRSEQRRLVGPGCGLIVGSVSDAGEPRATRAWAATIVDGDGGRVRLVVDAGDPQVVANISAGRQLAVTGADVRTLRSIQLKGQVVLVEPATAADLDEMTMMSSAFFEAVHEADRTDPALLHRLLPSEVMACELEVSEAYDQTPGPGAGVAMDGAGP